MATNTVIQITSNNHFPIKLTVNNFPVWRKQIQSTLIGLDLDQFIGDSQKPPAKFLDKESTKPNPEYGLWFRQDQVILSAILGSCSESIQPLISSAETSKEAWKRLVTSYANTSRSRVLSLKSKLAKNPKGTRSVAEFLHDMKSIADELSLVQSPVDDEDLLIHILGQLGDEFNTIVAALKVRESPISYPELFEKLVDFERLLKESAPQSPPPVMATVNFTQKQVRFSNSHQRRFPNGGAYSKQNRSQGPNYNGGNRITRNSLYCRFCNITGHETKDCRKLARFLKDNNVTVGNQNLTAPVANVTTASPTFMFDTGASHHITKDTNSLHTLSEYGGPDEILLGDGSSYGGAPNAGGQSS